MDVNKNTNYRLGILGEKLSHSLSPEIHQDLMGQLNIQGTYQKFEMTADEVPLLKPFMEKENIVGMNVTIPYKETVCRLVDILEPAAAKIGAVNTIFLKSGVLYGYNTDFLGVVSMFRKANIALLGKKIVILGSGGASRALIYGFHKEQAAQITVAARNQTASSVLKKQFPYIAICTLDKIPDGDIIINTTPIGMYPNAGKSPVSKEIVKKFKIASDIVYNPLMTEFLLTAQEQGLQIVTGLMMLVDQAIGAEEIWFRRKLDYTMGNNIHDELSRKF